MTIAPYRTRIVRSERELNAALSCTPLCAGLAHAERPVVRGLAIGLALVWQEFAERLDTVPVVQAIERGGLHPNDYLCLLRNLHRQASDAGRWLARAAASMRPERAPVSEVLLSMAVDRQRDSTVLTRNYLAAGGKLSELSDVPTNVGAEALSCFLFHHAGQPDPLCMFGALFVLEGVGIARAGRWAEKIQARRGLPLSAVSFLAYYSRHDDVHYERMRKVLDGPFVDEATASSIVRCARTVGRLYALQLEELDHT